MRAAQDKMNRLVGRALSRLHDLFDRRMAASHDENDSVGRFDRQCDFLYLQVDAPGAVQQNEMEAGRHFRRFGDPGEIALRPGSAETNRLGRLPLEVSHVRWK